VTSETIPASPADERMLEQLEAEFLRAPTDFWPAQSETALPVVEMPAAVPGWESDDGAQLWMTKYRTRTGCCG
jgi:hypothetical protein